MFSLLPISGDLVLIIKKRSRHLCFIAQKTEGQALPLNVYYHDSSGMSTMFFAFFSFSIFFCLAAALLHAPTGIRTRNVPFGNPTVLSRQPVPFGYERVSALGGIRTLKPPVLSRIHIPFWYKGMYFWRPVWVHLRKTLTPGLEPGHPYKDYSRFSKPLPAGFEPAHP